MGRERKKIYLTDDERMFITENHNLLLKFMHVHNIDIDQYYGVKSLRIQQLRRTIR